MNINIVALKELIEKTPHYTTIQDLRFYGKRIGVTFFRHERKQSMLAKIKREIQRRLEKA